MPRSELILEYFTVQPWSESIKSHFGLIDAENEGWKGFQKKVSDLQAYCGPHETIRVIYAGRHGQAEHNLLEKQYTPDEAFKHYQPDPLLTSLGESQADELREAYKLEIGDDETGLPKPELCFVSPLSRAGQTLERALGWLYESLKRQDQDIDDWGRGVPAIVIENLREHLNVNLCDKRSSVTELKKRFPSFDYSHIESDEDKIWKPTDRETDEQLVERAGKGFNDMLDIAGKDKTYLSLTAHSGYLRSLFGYFGVEQRRLSEGEMQILVVKTYDDE